MAATARVRVQRLADDQRQRAHPHRPAELTRTPSLMPTADLFFVPSGPRPAARHQERPPVAQNLITACTDSRQLRPKAVFSWLGRHSGKSFSRNGLGDVIKASVSSWSADCIAGRAFNDMRARAAAEALRETDFRIISRSLGTRRSKEAGTYGPHAADRTVPRVVSFW